MKRIIISTSLLLLLGCDFFVSNKNENRHHRKTADPSMNIGPSPADCEAQGLELNPKAKVCESGKPLDCSAEGKVLSADGKTCEEQPVSPLTAHQCAVEGKVLSADGTKCEDQPVSPLTPDQCAADGKVLNADGTKCEEKPYTRPTAAECEAQGKILGSNGLCRLPDGQCEAGKEWDEFTKSCYEPLPLPDDKDELLRCKSDENSFKGLCQVYDTPLNDKPFSGQNTVIITYDFVCSEISLFTSFGFANAFTTSAIAQPKRGLAQKLSLTNVKNLYFTAPDPRLFAEKTGFNKDCSLKVTNLEEIIATNP